MILSNETFTKFGYRPEELSQTSKRPVIVICDYCQMEIEKQYCKYIGARKTISQDCCSNTDCMKLKRRASFLEKYGVESPGQVVVKKMFTVRTNSKTGKMSEYNPWTESDIQYLKDNFEQKTCKEIGIDLNRTTRSVQHTFAALGLKRNIASVGDVINGWLIDDIYMKDIGTQKVSMAKISSVIDGYNIAKEERLTRLTNKQIPWPDNRRSDNVLRNTQHGESKTRLYRIWAGMKTRCLNEKALQWDDYGGRGITLYEEWNDFIAFREWALNNGYDDSLTLDRKNNDGNYEPNNCRWATEVQQISNKRNSSYTVLTAFGETKSIYEWLRDDRCVPTSTQCLEYRISAGWDHEVALTKPVERLQKAKISEWLKLNHPEIYNDWEKC